MFADTFQMPLAQVPLKMMMLRLSRAWMILVVADFMPGVADLLLVMLGFMFMVEPVSWGTPPPKRRKPWTRH